MAFTEKMLLSKTTFYGKPRFCDFGSKMIWYNVVSFGQIWELIIHLLQGYVLIIM